MASNSPENQELFLPVGVYEADVAEANGGLGQRVILALSGLLAVILVMWLSLSSMLGQSTAMGVTGDTADVIAPVIDR